MQTRVMCLVFFEGLGDLPRSASTNQKGARSLSQKCIACSVIYKLHQSETGLIPNIPRGSPRNRKVGETHIRNDCSSALEMKLRFHVQYDVRALVFARRETTDSHGCSGGPPRIYQQTVGCAFCLGYPEGFVVLVSNS